MERPRPMDRLLVGDVGYGKTEVALRAAFKAVEAGKQVAVLVPTTILAEQHGRTFRERLADYPVRIEVLSRFRSAKDSATVTRRMTRGEVDIVTATHGLLPAAVTFRAFGLLIVDEEHRFGVRHRERLKALKLSVDVLTLTAPPIPRTLPLSLAGLRDLTLLETPPKDRSPVLTFIEPWDDGLIEEALARELDRGGQGYFVHNRIETIDTIAERGRALAPPRARIAVAHGKLKEAELDAVMARFVRGEVDILVSTMIVESGLDVPNANTMIVNRADQLGLAQLYQLRGRVGRSHRRAYCYLLVPDLVDDEAEERLRVLEHHTDLGSAYRIALRDLELRGAGNLLGAAQSGHAQAVGFDTYLRWLQETVDALKSGKGDDGNGARVPPEVILDLPAHLSDEYVPDEAVKLELYRRLARAEAPSEIQAVREELRDRFGPLPDDAQRLLLVSELRALGARVGLDMVLVKGDEARLTFARDASPRLAGTAAGQTRTVDRLANMVGRAQRIPVRPDVVTGVANVYLDYAVFATELGRGRDLHDSALVLATQWPVAAQLKWEHYHDQLIATRGKLTPAQADSAFQAGTVRLFQHILIRIPQSAVPMVEQQKQKEATAVLTQAAARRGFNFAQLARRYSEDPGSKSKGGYLPATPRGQFVPAFDSAAWTLPPGAMTAVVRTPFGFHIIRRPPLAEVRDSFRVDLENSRTAQLDSLHLDSLANQRQLKIESGAPALVRQAVPQIVSARSDSRTLATYKGGTFRVKDLARWLLALDPNDVRGISAASDAQLNQFIKVLAQREMLLVEVDKAGVRLSPDDWRRLRSEHDSAVARLEGLLDVSPQLLKDSAATPAARVQLAMAHVDRYVDQAVTRGTAPFYPVPAFLAGALRH